MTNTTHATNDNSNEWNPQPNVLYEITLNPNDSSQLLQSTANRYTQVTRNLDTLLTNIKGIYYNLKTEFTMPQYGYEGKMARIHFHGLIKFYDIQALRNFYIYHFHQITKRYSIQLNNYRPKIWDEYINKQQYMQSITNKELSNTTIQEIKKPTPTHIRPSPDIQVSILDMAERQ